MSDITDGKMRGSATSAKRSGDMHQMRTKASGFIVYEA